jgi:biopolymer transport protein ExbB/TolQ
MTLYPTHAQQTYYHLIHAISKFFLLSPQDFQEIINEFKKEENASLDEDDEFIEELVSLLEKRMNRVETFGETQ